MANKKKPNFLIIITPIDRQTITDYDGAPSHTRHPIAVTSGASLSTTGLLRHLRITALAAFFEANVIFILAISIATILIKANCPQHGARLGTGRLAMGHIVERQAGACDKKKKSDLFKHDIPFIVMVEKNRNTPPFLMLRPKINMADEISQRFF